MPATPKLSNFTALVGTELWKLNGQFQFQFDVKPNSVLEVLQNLYEIFSVPLGSQPYLRSFGQDVTWIDLPGNIATMQAQTSFLLACSKWEPRAKFNKIQFIMDPAQVMAGVYSLYVELTISLDAQITTNLFSLIEPFKTWVISNDMKGDPVTIDQERLTI